MASQTITLDAAQRMDRMYRYTRHVYDASRKFYLLGRDAMLRQMAISDGDHVLEVGCGTARNLIKLNRLAPGAHLFGLDASNVMLDTARRSLRRHGCDGRVQLKQCLAEELDASRTFGLTQPFDAIYFSYSLSMIPTWRQAIDAALANLSPSGTIYVVDFWDQAELPRWFARTLSGWLAKFGVHHRPELVDHLTSLRDHGATVAIKPIARRYAMLAQVSQAS